MESTEEISTPHFPAFVQLLVLVHTFTIVGSDTKLQTLECFSQMMHMGVCVDL